MLKFWKAEGTGNDFIFYDATVGSADSLGDRRVSARRLCDRHRGIGADGFVVIEKSATGKAQLQWDFYNADGTSAQMCGNAARCLYGVLSQKGETRPVLFETRSGIVKVQSTENLDKTKDFWVAVELSKPREVWADQTLTINSQALQTNLIDSGVPHLTVECDAGFLKNADIAMSRPLRNRADLGPEGANVTFWTKQSQDSISIRTYERGVEDFTLSCGTGAIAAAWAFQRKYPAQRLNVYVPGGHLVVQWDLNNLRLFGPTRVIGQFELNAAVLGP